MFDVIAAQRLANILAGRQGLTARFHDGDRHLFYTTAAGELCVPKPQLGWSHLDAILWRCGLHHEIGHQHPECVDIFEVLQAYDIDTQTAFGAALNILDDVRNDMARTDRYPGTLRDLIEGMEHIARSKIVPDLGKLDDASDKANHILAVMFAMSFHLRGVRDGAPMSTICEDIVTSLPEWPADKWQIIVRDGWLDKAQVIETAREEYLYTRDLFREVFDVADEDLPPVEPPPQDGESDASADSGLADPEGGEEKETFGGGKVTVDYQEMLLHKHHDDAARGEPCDVNFDYSGYTGRQPYSPHTLATTYIGPPQRDSSLHTHVKSPAILAAYTSSGAHKVANKARQYLQTITRKRPLPDQRSGRLDPHRYKRAVTHKDWSTQPLVYKTPAPRKELDTSVSVLVDASGSMIWGNKYALASAAALALVEMCATLRVRCEVAYFSEVGHTNNHHMIIKEFNAPKFELAKLAAYMQDASAYMVNNADGDNILIAANRLRAEKSAKKLLVVLSDGEPGATRGDIYGYTKEVIQSIESSGIIDILGIGILDTNVKRLYKVHYTIKRAEDIPNGIINVLKQHIISSK